MSWNLRCLPSACTLTGKSKFLSGKKCCSITASLSMSGKILGMGSRSALPTAIRQCHHHGMLCMLRVHRTFCSCTYHTQATGTGPGATDSSKPNFHNESPGSPGLGNTSIIHSTLLSVKPIFSLDLILCHLHGFRHQANQRCFQIVSDFVRHFIRFLTDMHAHIVNRMRG